MRSFSGEKAVLSSPVPSASVPASSARVEPLSYVRCATVRMGYVWALVYDAFCCFVFFWQFLTSDVPVPCPLCQRARLCIIRVETPQRRVLCCSNMDACVYHT